MNISPRTWLQFPLPQTRNKTSTQHCNRQGTFPKHTSTDTFKKAELVPFIVTYNPLTRSISSIMVIIREHINILTSSPRCQNVLKTIPLVAFRRSSNLKSYLVRAKVHHPTAQQNQPLSSYRCDNNCSTCTYVTRTDKLVTHSIPRAKQNILRILTSTAIQLMSSTWYSTIVALNNTLEKPNEPVGFPIDE